MADLTAFAAEILARLLPPVETYYDAVERAAARPTGPLGLAHGLAQRLTVRAAQAKMRADLHAVFQLAYQVAGNYGNDGQTLNDRQYREVLRRLAEAERYLDGFVADAPNMSRAEALSRIARYIAPIIQAVSAVAASDLPALPIMPGDSRLACSAKVRACKCYLRIQRVGRADWDVTWVQTAAESCPDCERLGKAWTPLKIRNGRVLEARAA